MSLEFFDNCIRNYHVNYKLGHAKKRLVTKDDKMNIKIKRAVAHLIVHQGQNPEPC